MPQNGDLKWPPCTKMKITILSVSIRLEEVRFVLLVYFDFQSTSNYTIMFVMMGSINLYT